MRIRNYSLIAAIAFLWAALSISQAQAEMGRAPAGADGFYFSFFGGYVHQDGPDHHAYRSNMGATNHFFAVKDGGFAGVDLGFVLGDGIAPFGMERARIEASFSANIFDDDKDSRTGAILTGADAAFTITDPISPAGHVQEREVFDGSISLKGELAQVEVVALTGALEFFVRSSEDKSSTFCCSGFGGRSRTANVDSMYYGALVALQPEFDLGNGLSFATDFGFGLYVVDGEGKFASNVTTNPSFSNSRTNVGMRGRLGGALKFAITNGAAASLFGTVDYWSDTTFAEMPQPANGFVPARVGLESLVEAKAGVRVTVAFGGP